MHSIAGIVNARVIDGLGGVIDRATVAISDGRIDRVEPGATPQPIPDGWLDLAGRTLLPGLVDAHVHLSSYPEYLGIPPSRRGELPLAREAGVTLAMGFDSAPHGANVLKLIRMVEGELTPMQGLVAAISGSATALGLPDIGRIAPDAVADLVVVDGAPLADIRLLMCPERLWLVVQGGRPVAGAVLDAPDPDLALRVSKG